MISGKRTRDKIFNSHIGYGIILCKTAEDTIKEIEFNQGSDGKFRTFGREELPEFSKLFNIVKETE